MSGSLRINKDMGEGVRFIGFGSGTDSRSSFQEQRKH